MTCGPKIESEHIAIIDAQEKRGGFTHNACAFVLILLRQTAMICTQRHGESGSAWESNPPIERFTLDPTVLKTAATTRCAGTSEGRNENPPFLKGVL